MEWYIPLLVLIAGFTAGAINTLAGSGSVVTISLLTFLGLDPLTANGTNRIGVLVQSVTGARTFIRSHSEIPSGAAWQVFPSVIGAVAGSWLASEMSPESMGKAIGWLFAGLLLLILFRPSQWLRQESVPRSDHRHPLSLLMFFLIGVYGGFIQAGVGILLLSALVLYSGFNLNTSNAVKLICVAVFTVPALAIFIWKGQVNWWYGMLMAVGQSGGAFLAARYAMRSPAAAVWVRRLLIAVVVVSIIRFLELYHYLPFFNQ